MASCIWSVSVPYLLVSGLYLLGIFLFFGFFRKSEREIELLSEIELVVASDEEMFDVT